MNRVIHYLKGSENKPCDQLCHDNHVISIDKLNYIYDDRDAKLVTLILVIYKKPSKRVYSSLF